MSIRLKLSSDTSARSLTELIYWWEDHLKLEWSHQPADESCHLNIFFLLDQQCECSLKGPHSRRQQYSWDDKNHGYKHTRTLHRFVDLNLFFSRAMTTKLKLREKKQKKKKITIKVTMTNWWPNFISLPPPPSPLPLSTSDTRGGEAYARQGQWTKRSRSYCKH